MYNKAEGNIKNENQLQILDQKFMVLALEEAKKAVEKDEVPIGAVVVKNGEVISKAHNLKESLKLASAHAEVLAINAASDIIGGWRLTDCSLYVTIEPCAMCAGLIYQARISRLIFGASELRSGACGTVMNVLENPKLNHHVEISSGVLENECTAIIQAFFKAKRIK